MKGRLENKLKTEKHIDEILSDCPRYLQEYYYSISTSLTHKTCLEYVRKIKNFLLYIDSNLKLVNPNRMTQTAVISFLKSIEIKSDSDGNITSTSFSYRKTYYAALNGFFDFMKCSKYLNSNPCDNIRPIKRKDDVQHVFLTKEELREIIADVESRISQNGFSDQKNLWLFRDKAILLLFMNTGMRETALCEINVEDINFDEHILSIVDKGEVNHHYVLNDAMETALRTWVSARRILLAGMKLNSDALFISNQRTRICAQTISDIVKKYTQSALGYSVSPHKLRAAFCNILLKESNGDLHFVSHTVGHKNIQTTETYLDKDELGNRKRASSMMSDILFSD